MTTDDPENSLAAALVALQAGMPAIGKDAQAQYGRYADLADVSKALLPAMTGCGLAFTAKPTMVIRPDGARDFVLAYKLVHAPSGETDEGEYPLGTGNPQQLGSAITYARRYALCAVTGAVADIDDDGQAASQQPQTQRPKRGKPPMRALEDLPRNQDGSLSRSKCTEEELAHYGAMDTASQKQHNRLERDVLGTNSEGKSPPSGERLGGTPPEDPFYDAPPPAGLRTPAPAGSPVAVIQQLFKKLGYSDSPEDRTARLGKLSDINGRLITSTNDLTAAEGVKTIRLLKECPDLAALDERLAARELADA